MLELVYLKKDGADASVNQQLFMDIRDKYRYHIPVYTDSSRDGNSVACASFSIKHRNFHEIASNFTAEIWAIIKALEEKKIMLHPNTMFYRLTFVFSSFTIYEAETSLDWDGDTKMCRFKVFQKDIILCWVPNHIGIRGNERAYSAAKSALYLPHARIGVPYNNSEHCINQYILSTWQDDWNGAVAYKLHSVKTVLGDW